MDEKLLAKIAENRNRIAANSKGT